MASARLDPDQKKVIQHREGPALVVAGPGSGKTLALIQRIARIIIKKWARPEEIVALTFTDAAATEMRERVDELVPYGYIQTFIGTFHSFAQRILTEFGPEVGIDPDLRIIANPELFLLVRENIFSFGLEEFLPISNPEKHIQRLLNHISRLKTEDISPEEYLEYAEKVEDPKLIEIGRFYQRLEGFLESRGLIDINGLITTTLKILRKRPDITQTLQDRFRFLLIDEFQDTNFAQYQLIKLLVGKDKNIMVVGDDDQSIFKFQGAAITNILTFKDDFPDARIYILKKNYRSLPELIQISYRLIRNNDPDRLEIRLGIDKRIEPVRSGQGEVKYFFFQSLDHEADEIAQLILKEHEQGIPYAEIAILIRNNRDADPIIRSLNFANIPWRFSGNRGLFDRKEIRLLLSFLHVIADPDDSVHLYNLLGSEFYQPKGIALNRASARARRRNESLFQVIADPEFLTTADAESRAAFERAVSDIERYSQLSMEETSGKVLFSYLKEKGYLKRLLDQGIEGEIKAKNISRFFDLINRIGGLIEIDRIPKVVEMIELLRKGGENPPVAEADLDLDAVNILTVHSAKGKEFTTVFIAGLYQGNFPTDPARRRAFEIPIPDDLLKEKLPKTSHLQEERRLFYVALTRARDRIYLSGSRDVGTKRPREPSQFIAEALDLHKRELEVMRRGRIDELKVSEEKPVYIKRKITRITPNQIDDYLTCPLKYKFIHDLRVQITRHHTVVFGMAIHAAIAYFLRAKLEKREPSLDRMIQVYRTNWSAEGFLSREHEELSFQRGIRMLTRFYHEEIGKPPPSLVEADFSFTFGDLRIVGRWDRVDLDDGGAVIDYKTSENVDQEKANREARESIQLMIYAMAFQATYGHLPERVELRFVDTGIVGRMKRIEEKIRKAEVMIAQTIEGIRSGRFDPKPKHLACRFCPYIDLCDYENKRC